MSHQEVVKEGRGQKSCVLLNIGDSLLKPMGPLSKQMCYNDGH